MILPLLSQLFNIQFKTSLESLKVIAKSEGLDEFVEVEESKLGLIEYCTAHGSRWLSKDHPELNLFLVLTKGDGFARAVPMPYIRTYNNALEIPQLVVEYCRPDAPATIAGYAQAVPLPNLCAYDDIYIEGLGILDTEYAAMLANHS